MKLTLPIMSLMFFSFGMAMQPGEKGDFYDQLCLAIKKDDQVGVETLFKEPNSAWKIGHWLSKYDPNMCSEINVMSKGHALIHWAARANNLDILDVLLNDKKTQVDKINAHGCTALGFAVAGGKVSVTSLLLNHGADPNAISDKEYCKRSNDEYHMLLHTGIMYYSQCFAKKDDYYKVIGLLLLDPRTDPNIQDSSGQTPLHYAVKLRSEKIVVLLLKNSKTKKDIVDKANKMPVDYARELKDEKIKILLINHIK